MAEPITWRNVTGPSPADALRPLEAAGQSFKGALSSLEQMLSGAQQVASNKITRTNDEAEAAYRSLLDTMKSPEEMAQRQGEMSALLQSMDPLRAAKLLNLDDDKRKGVYQNIKDENTYKNDQLAYRDNPVYEKFADLIYQGKFKEAREGLAAHVKTTPDFSRQDDVSKLSYDYEKMSARDRAEATSRALSNRNSLLGIRKGEREEADAAEQRRFATDVAKRASEYRNQQQIAGEQYADIARQKGLKPLIGSNGRIDTEMVQRISNYSDKDLQELWLKNPEAYRDAQGKREALNILKREAASKNLPPLDLLMGSDTQAGVLALRDMQKSGQYSDLTLANGRDSAITAFNPIGDPVAGRDKVLQDRLAAERQVDLQRDVAEGWTLPGSPKAQEMVKTITAGMMDKINTADGLGAEKDLPAMRTAVTKVLNEGIKVGNQYVVPSEALILEALSAASGSWFTDGQHPFIAGRDDSFRKILQKLAEANPEKAKKAAANDIADREMRIKNTLRGGK